MKKTILLKSLSKLGLAASIVSLSMFSSAETRTFQTVDSNLYASGSFPMESLPDVSNINNAKIIVDQSLNGHFNVERLIVDFDHVKDLNVKNFTYDPSMNEYVARVKNIWIFRELIVAIKMDGAVGGYGPKVELRIPNESGFNNTIGGGFPYLNFDMALIEDVSSNAQADYAKVKVDGKWMTLRVYKNHMKAWVNSTSGRFKIVTNWQGHGDREMLIDTPETIYGGKAVSITVLDDPIDPNNKTIEVKYEKDGRNPDDLGVVSISLNDLLMQLYQFSN